MPYDDVNVLFLKKNHVGFFNVVLLLSCKIVIVTIFYRKYRFKKNSFGPTVVIKNGDLHDAGPAQLEGPALLLGLQVRQLQEELLVRLPLVVVHDRDANLITDIFIMM